MKQMYSDPMELNTTNRSKPGPNKSKKKQKGLNSGNPTQGKKCYGCGKKGHFQRNCRFNYNKIFKDNIIAATEEYNLNAITQEYFTKVATIDRQFWEEVSSESNNSIWQNAQNDLEKEFDPLIQQNNHDESEKNFKLEATFNLAKFKGSKIKIIYSNKLGKITQYLPVKLWLKKTVPKSPADSRNLGENLNE